MSQPDQACAAAGQAYAAAGQAYAAAGQAYAAAGCSPARRDELVVLGYKQLAHG